QGGERAHDRGGAAAPAASREEVVAMVGHRVYGECVEQLHTWVLAHCARALEEPEFLPGLIAIVKLEADRAQQDEPARVLKKSKQPWRARGGREAPRAAIGRIEERGGVLGAKGRTPPHPTRPSRARRAATRQSSARSSPPCRAWPGGSPASSTSRPAG